MRLRASTIAAGLASASLTFLTSASVIAAPSLPAEVPQIQSAVPQIVPASLWSVEALQELRLEVAAAAAEGLDPEAYDPDRLAAAVAAGASSGTDQLATTIALALARDYSVGRITDKSRFDWHIEREADMNKLRSDLGTALSEKRVGAWLRSLLPTDPRYAALRDAYAAAPAGEVGLRDRLRANLERWRWMPRDLGADHIYVNVPSYNLAVVEDGQKISTYTVVVGKPSTPTPQIAVEARSIVVNPWWNVPPSISSHMKSGARGFVSSGNGGLRQPPGPRNALGRVKIDMPNPHSIYLHDTPSKSLFAESSRAFSHGCIRVKDIDRLAAELAVLDAGNDRAVEQALAGSATRTVPLREKRPVYLVYFTAEADSDGKIATYDDPYGRDRKVVEALSRTTRLAALSQKRKIG